MVRAIVDQTTHVASVGVVSEQDRLVFGEQVSEVSVGDSLIVLLGGLQLDQIHNVDDLELDAELVELVGSSHDLLSRNVASGGEHDLASSLDLAVEAHSHSAAPSRAQRELRPGSAK